MRAGTALKRFERENARVMSGERTSRERARLPLQGVDAAVLAGGLGTRLRGVVDDVPKPLAPVLGRPFLFYQLDLLALRGARSVTLCCGYLAEHIRGAVGEEWLGMPVRYSVETEPMGTGGALGLAAGSLESDVAVVLNGDSWLEPDWAALLRGAAARGAAVALAEVEETGRYGAVALGADGVVEAFVEKGAPSGPRFINGGVYAMKQGLLKELRGGRSSLERYWLPQWVAEGRVAGERAGGAFIDIGTPESYAAAGRFFEGLGIAPDAMFPDRPPKEGVVPKLGTCAVIFDDAGRVVMERRSDCGWWCLPGGRLDAGETLAEGAAREAREETGLEIEIEGFLGVFSDPRRRTVRYPDNGDLRQLVDAVVMARPRGGFLRRSAESLDVGWFEPAGLPLNTVPPVVEILREAYRWEGVAVLR